jgi:hypothetical protein
MVCLTFLSKSLLHLFDFRSRLECFGGYLDATERTTSSVATSTAAATSTSSVFDQYFTDATSWSHADGNAISTVTANTTWHCSTPSPATGWFKYHSGKFNDDKY